MAGAYAGGGGARNTKIFMLSMLDKKVPSIVKKE